MDPLKIKSILIVEDDEDILFALQNLLENEGFAVHLAENGAIALKFLETHEIPDLILLDMLMPIMNGWEFAAVFSSKYDRSCPIVVITAAADAEQRAKDVGAIGYIEKPFPLKKLLELIKKILVL